MPALANAKVVLTVAVPSPLRREFDYLLPASLSPEHHRPIAPGVRVRVPFGSRELIGIVLKTGDNSTVPEDKLKPIIEIIDQAPIVDETTLALYLWASRYYQHPLGMALQTSLPKFVREGRALAHPQEVFWRHSQAVPDEGHNISGRAHQQLKIFELLKSYQHLSTDEVSALLGSPASGLLKKLKEKGLIESYYETPKEDKGRNEDSTLYGEDQPLPLNPEQAAAFNSVSAELHHFHCFLLEGITGSGKTEVYLQLIAKVLQNGQQVLVLIPEISLTPQTLMRFQQRFKATVVTLHSGLNDTERFSAWLKARNNEAAIIIGTRSAVFTPLLKPGLIIVDEEHDSSYKQQDGFRYSARDLAIFRAHKLNIPIVLGTATPSLESLHKALSSRYRLLHLPKRAGIANPPTFRFLDIRGQDLDEGFSQPLLEAIKDQLDQGNQALVFINRRGYAPLLQCHACGWAATCPSCETGYTLHQNPPNLRCHHCDSQIRLVQNCPACGSNELAAIGLGTERSEKVLNKHFSEVPVLRIDRDTTRGKQAMGRMIDTVNSGKPCILIGTQMLAKGHHFPGVTLVAILDADSGLFSADFRGQEHMGQLFTQVAGRAGRGENSGEVLIQTHHSQHPSLLTLVKDGYGVFARKLLEERQVVNLPPYFHQILFRAESSQRGLSEQFLGTVRQLGEKFSMSSISVLGPMPAPMEKRAGRFRAQLLLQSAKRSDLHQFSNGLIHEIEQLAQNRKVRWSVDVDPIDFT